MTDEMNPKVSMPSDKQKVFLPAEVIQLISSIVDNISKAKSALQNANQGNYAKAVQDLLSVIESIVVDMILPRLKAGQPKAGEPDDTECQEDHDHAEDDQVPEGDDVK